MDRRRGQCECDREPPHQIVGARALVDHASEPDAEERADLVQRKTKPNSIPTWRVPNMTATSPEVGGTVESHSRPMRGGEQQHDGAVVAGTSTKSANSTARPA